MAAIAAPPVRDIKFQLASDIHLESIPLSSIDYRRILIPSAPYLLLCGDIGNPGRLDDDGWIVFRDFITHCCKHWQRVIMVAGNHEYWIDDERTDVQPHMAQIRERMTALTRDHTNYHFLDRSTLHVDGIKIIGATLWTHVPAEAHSFVQSLMKDYRKILVVDDDRKHAIETKQSMVMTAQQERDALIEAITGIKTIVTPSTAVTLATTAAGQVIANWKPDLCIPLTVGRMVALHNEDKAFIEAELKASTRIGEACMVITHHPPTFMGTTDGTCLSSSERYSEASDLDYMLEGLHHRHLYAALRVWCYGHTHWCAHDRMPSSAVHLHANQMGYYSHRSLPFKPDFVFTINAAPFVPPPPLPVVIAPAAATPATTTATHVRHAAIDDLPNEDEDDDTMPPPTPPPAAVVPAAASAIDELTDDLDALT